MTRRDVPEDWDPFIRGLGLRLQRHRIALGMSQEELAHAAGLTRSHYQQLEKGLSRPKVTANPSLLTLVSLATAMGIPVTDLLAEQDAQAEKRREA